MRDLDLVELEEKANEGDYEACLELSRRYREGDGVSVDISLADKYLEFAKQFGAVEEVEIVQETQSTQSNESLHEILEILKRKAIVQLYDLVREGNVYAQYTLALRVLADEKNVAEGFEQILSCEKEVKEALKTHKEPALKELFVELEDLIGKCYEEGKGTDVSYSLAFEHYSNAYEFDPTHSDNIERCYREGIGCEKNSDKALQLVEKRMQSAGFEEKYAYGMQFVENNAMKAALWLQSALLASDANHYPVQECIARLTLAKLNETDALGNAIDTQAEFMQILALKEAGNPTAILFAYEEELLPGKQAFCDENRNHIWENSVVSYDKLQADLQVVVNSGTKEEVQRASHYLSNLEQRKQFKQQIQEKASILCQEESHKQEMTQEELRLVQSKIYPELQWYIEKETQGNTQWAKKYISILDERIRITEAVLFKKNMLNYYYEGSRQYRVDLDDAKQDRKKLHKIINSKTTDAEWAKTCLSILNERVRFTEIDDFKREVQNDSNGIWRLNYKDRIQQYESLIKKIQTFDEEHGFDEGDGWKDTKIQDINHAIQTIKNQQFKDEINRIITKQTRFDDKEGRNEYYNQLRSRIEEYMKDCDETDKAWGKEKLEILNQRDKRVKELIRDRKEWQKMRKREEMPFYQWLLFAIVKLVIGLLMLDVVTWVIAKTLSIFGSFGFVILFVIAGIVWYVRKHR